MVTPTIRDLPAPPNGRTGWPWTEESPPLPATMPDGAPWPRISIVTPSFNQGRFIEETIRSVLLQGYPNLDYIIIDGGSRDETVEIIRKYEPWLSYWVSEPDQGQSDAINKGLSRADGQYFNFLNSDDFLAPGALRVVAEGFGSAHILAGGCRNFYDDTYEEEGIIWNRELEIPQITGFHKGNFAYHQPAVWLRTDLAIRCGSFDDRFHYMFDREMLLRYLSLFPEVRYVNARLANFRLHPGSKTTSYGAGASRFFREHVLVFEKLSRCEGFETLHPYCKHAYRRLRWVEIVIDTQVDPHLSRWQRIERILSGTLADPLVRLSRFTFGSLRNC
ncbi:MAG: glycosyltransferase [Caldilineaceae bacterium]|nr:glycosyltransferase [Caldilineaceae bacterium]